MLWFSPRRLNFSNYFYWCSPQRETWHRAGQTRQTRWHRSRPRRSPLSALPARQLSAWTPSPWAGSDWNDFAGWGYHLITSPISSARRKSCFFTSNNWKQLKRTLMSSTWNQSSTRGSNGIFGWCFHLKTGCLLDFVEVDIRPRILARHHNNST